MSKLNYNRKTFLSKEELQREQLFRSDESMCKILLMSITKTWGIVSKLANSSSTELRVTADTNPGTIRIAPGYAVNKSQQLITVPEIRYLPVPNTNTPYYVFLSYASVNWEDGTVSVDVNGNLSGLNTSFLGVLRGQGSLAPINIKFAKEDGTAPLNSGIYEIVNVINNTSAVINSSNSMVAEQNLKMIVLGTLPIGVDFSEEQMQGLYTYDRYDASKLLTVSGSGGAKPSYIPDEEFLIAKVTNNNGVITIADQDTLREYWSI